MAYSANSSYLFWWGIHIRYNGCLWCNDDHELIGSPIWNWSQMSRLNMLKICLMARNANASFIFSLECSYLALWLLILKTWKQMFGLLIWPWIQRSMACILKICLLASYFNFFVFHFRWSVFSSCLWYIDDKNTYWLMIWPWSQRSRSNIRTICLYGLKCKLFTIHDGDTLQFVKWLHMVCK